MHTQKYTLPHLCKHTHSFIFIYMNTHRHTHSTLPACILPRTCPFTHLYRTTHTYTCSNSCFTQDFWGCASSSSENLGVWRSYSWHKCRRTNTRTALHYMLVNLGGCFSKKAPQSLAPGSYKQTMRGLEVLRLACDEGSAHVSNRRGRVPTQWCGREGGLETR